MRAVLISDYRNRALAGSGPARKGARLGAAGQRRVSQHTLADAYAVYERVIEGVTIRENRSHSARQA